MTRKVLGNAVTDTFEKNGDSTHFGTQDIDQINNLLSGQDQSSTDPVPINTTTTFGSGKLIATNASLTTPTVTGSGGTLTLPAGPDTMVARNTTDSLKNKDVTDVSNTFPTSLVTLTTAQTLTHKNLTDATNTFPTSLATIAGVQALTNKNLTDATNTFPSSLVTTTGTQTLTGKTIDWQGPNTVKIPSAFGHTIFKVGTTYYAMNGNTGNVDYSGSVPETVIQNALNNSGSIYINPGSYQFSASFSGINVITNNQIKMSRNAVLSVPAGYTGPVFHLTRRVYQCIIEGGWLNDPSLPTNRGAGVTTPGTFTGVYMECVGTPAVGQSFNIFKNMYIENAAIGLHFKVDNVNQDFMSSNAFRDIFLMTPNIGVQFETTNTGQAGGVSETLFSDVEVQAGGNITNGWKDIQGGFNVFEKCFCWDFGSNNASAVSANFIANNTQANMILGGNMGIANFADLAPSPNRTFRIDPYAQIISAPDAALTVKTVGVTSNSTGAGSAALGSNSPATTNTAPYTWLKHISSDGSTVWVPAWK